MAWIETQTAKMHGRSRTQSCLGFVMQLRVCVFALSSQAEPISPLSDIDHPPHPNAVFACMHLPGNHRSRAASTAPRLILILAPHRTTTRTRTRARARDDQWKWNRPSCPLMAWSSGSMSR